MKLSEKLNQKKMREGTGFSKVAVNERSKNWILVAIVLVTILAIAGVVSIGNKAGRTVGIVMLKDGAYKNQPITESMMVEYPMVQSEYEMYSIIDNKGVKERRLILWEERNQIIGAFAAYPIASETPVEYRSLVSSRVDNSDAVLYSFPGKDILPLNMGASDLNAFKTFLQPGDKLNIEAVYSEDVVVREKNVNGEDVEKTVKVFRTDPVFGNIQIADLINASGGSILDIYSQYNDKTIFEQAQLDASQAFQESVTPKTLFVALTPQEKKLYYKYTSKSDVEFKIALPQRTQ